MDAHHQGIGRASDELTGSRAGPGDNCVARAKNSARRNGMTRAFSDYVESENV